MRLTITRAGSGLWRFVIQLANCSRPLCLGSIAGTSVIGIALRNPRGASSPGSLSSPRMAIFVSAGSDRSRALIAYGGRGGRFFSSSVTAAVSGASSPLNLAIMASGVSFGSAAFFEILASAGGDDPASGAAASDLATTFVGSAFSAVFFASSAFVSSAFFSSRDFFAASIFCS